MSTGAPNRGRLVRVFRATDAFTIDAFEAVRSMPNREGDALAREIRRVASRTGAALVAASLATPGAEEERSGLEKVRTGLMEVRYLLYLTRRLGILDRRRYRALAAAQDTAFREVEGILSRPP